MYYRLASSCGGTLYVVVVEGTGGFQGYGSVVFDFMAARISF